MSYKYKEPSCLYIVYDNTIKEDHPDRRVIVFKAYTSKYDKILYYRIIWYNMRTQTRYVDCENVYGTKHSFGYTPQAMVEFNDDQKDYWVYLDTEKEFLERYGWILFV